MSNMIGNIRTMSSASPRPAASAPALLGSIWRRIAEFGERRRLAIETRHALMLDDHLLRDIGLTRHDLVRFRRGGPR